MGTHTFYVTQTEAVNGCEGPADTVTLTIHAVPSIPVAVDTAICDGDSVPAFSAAGTNLHWYADTALSQLVFVGNPFDTALAGAGTYTFFVADSLVGCPQSDPDTATLEIKAIPTAPGSNDTLVCVGDPVPDLIASGTGIQWYSDSALTTMVHAGGTFATGNSLAGAYTYFATQTTNGCEGPAVSVTLTIQAAPTTPNVGDTAICEGDTVPVFTASGGLILWYSDGGLDTLVNQGDTFDTNLTQPGVYTFYVTDSVLGCAQSPADTFALTINATPAAPVGGDTAVCFGDPVPNLVMTGTGVQWYATATLDSVIQVGDTLDSLPSTVGVQTYFATQTVNGCEGPADSATLIIHAIPTPPVGADTAICEGDSVPDLTATGTNITWYSDTGLTTMVGSGDSLATGQTVPGTYAFYATQTINGCESPADTVTLTIHGIPAAPVASDTSICFGDTVAPLIGVGFNLAWYSDTGLSVMVASGDSLFPGDTAAGVHVYYVTQTINGCESPADTAEYTIHALPSIPVGSDTSICFGDSVPDLTGNR